MREGGFLFYSPSPLAARFATYESAVGQRQLSYDEEQRAASAAVFDGACATCLGLHGAAGGFFSSPFSHVSTGIWYM